VLQVGGNPGDLDESIAIGRRIATELPASWATDRINSRRGFCGPTTTATTPARSMSLGLSAGAALVAGRLTSKGGAGAGIRSGCRR
jgi:hypothetical protein